MRDRSDWITIAALVPVGELEEMLKWLHDNQPDWQFNYGDTKEASLAWYKRMAGRASPDQTQTWHLVLDRPTAMLLRLTRETYLVGRRLTS